VNGLREVTPGQRDEAVYPPDVDALPGEHPNVAIVRRSLLEIARGEIGAAMEDWAPDARYHAFDADGVESRDVHRAEQVVAMGQRLLAHHDNDVVDIRPVGDELVLLQMRTRAVSRSGRRLTSEFLIVVSVRDGKIRWACDFIDSALQAFLDDAWS
jgi:ketosteroid isomerase-like protein